jgi:hypothetical protein
VRDIFYQLPEAAHIDQLYSIMEFIQANHKTRGLGYETIKLGSGFLFALEAALTQQRFMFDLKSLRKKLS